MSIELTSEQQAIIESRGKAGFYESPRTMIDRALDVLEEKEDRLARQRAFFEREIKPSIDDLDRGEGTPLLIQSYWLLLADPEHQQIRDSQCCRQLLQDKTCVAATLEM